MPDSHETNQHPGILIAVSAEILYLLNLLLLPGLAFLALLILWQIKAKHCPPLAKAHLQQTIVASLWAGVMLVIVNITIILLGGYDGPWIWVIVIIYFTICHAALVLLGAYGLSKALAGQCWRFPLVGLSLPEGCH